MPPPPGPCACGCSVLPIPSACRLPCGANSSGEACPCVPPSSAVLLLLRGQGNRLQGGRDIPAHKVEVDFNLLRGVLAAFPARSWTRIFSTKLVEHGICQRVKILILVNQGNKFLRRFPALLISGNGFFQLRDFRIRASCSLAYCASRASYGRPAPLAQGVVLIDFANQAFPVPRPAFGRRPTVSASWRCQRSAGQPAFPGQCG